MGLRINNSESAAAQRFAVANRNAVAEIMARLSSGERISKASDDPAGLSVSERMRAELSSIEQAQRNSYDGVSVASFADAAAGQVEGILQRVRELSVQYNNGTLDSGAREAITTEVGQLNQQLNQVMGSSTFNGISLLNSPGGATVVTIQIGIQDYTDIPVIGFDGQAAMGSVVSDFASMGGAGGTVDVSQIDAALESVRGYRSEMGAVSNRFAAASDMLSVERENLMASESRIRDADMALEISNLTAAQIRSQTSISALAMTNRNSSHLLALLN